MKPAASAITKFLPPLSGRRCAAPRCFLFHRPVAGQRAGVPNLNRNHQ
jgi:hypothetical protein